MLSVLHLFHLFTTAIRALIISFRSMTSVESSLSIIIISLSVSFADGKSILIRLCRFSVRIPSKMFNGYASVFGIRVSGRKTIAEGLVSLRSSYVACLTQHLQICAIINLNVI